MRQFEQPEFLDMARKRTPRKTIAERFKVAEATIGGWIAMARQAGLLASKHHLQKVSGDHRSEIILLASQELPVREIVKRTGVGKTTVRKILAEENVFEPRNLRKWTPSMDAVLRELYPTKTTSAQIGEKLGMTADQVQKRARRIGLRSPAINSSPMSEAELAKIEALWKTHGPAEIGRMLGRSANSISAIAHRRGWEAKIHYPERRKDADRDYAEAKTRAKPRKSPRPAHTLKVVAPEVIPETAKPMLQHKTGECRYPYGQRGNIHYCCQPVFREGGPYCEGHSAICFDYDRMRKRAA